MDARSHLLEALSLPREVGDNGYVVRILEELALLNHLSGDNARATRLFGAAEMLRELIGFPKEPV